MKHFFFLISLITAACLLLLPFIFSQHIAADEPADKLVYSSQKNSSMKIAITFDDGPHPRHTPEILDILREYDVPATFFVVGINAHRYPDIILREIREGHEIGNHTYSHANLKKTGRAALADEIIANEDALYEIAEYRPKLIRPPGGLYNEVVCMEAENLDYRIVLWTVDTRDWSKPSTEAIIETVRANVKSGDILLFHDLIAGDSPTPSALRTIIPELLSQGYKFVTVSELISSE